MDSRVLWTVANIFLFNALQAHGSLPIPVLLFEEDIVADLDMSITCFLPYNDLPDVKLIIRGNATLTDCNSKKGNYPNVTCTLDVTREMHEMEFTCEAQFTTQSQPQKINIQTEPKFTDCPDKLVWLEGQEISFHCKAKGYPPPTVTCGKNSTIYKDGEKFRAMRNMSGEYKCEAKNDDVISRTVTVSVEYKPKISIIKVSPPLHAEGDKVEITCEADGLPEPTFTWNTPSSHLQFSPDNRTVTATSLTNSQLGDYECTVQNKHGMDTATQRLALAVKPTILNLTIKPSAQVLEGENVTLTCDAKGIPPPVISWTPPVPDVELSGDKRTVRIWGVKKTHVGLYICKAHNQHGTDTKTQQLSLGVKPKIDKIAVRPSSTPEEGANVTLTCVAQGVPPPTYSWESPTSDIELSPDKSAIKIWRAKKSHEGDYKCKVENAHGSDTRTERISVMESKGSRGERRDPATATILVMLISTNLLFYLC